MKSGVENVVAFLAKFFALYCVIVVVLSEDIVAGEDDFLANFGTMICDSI
jgi:hypothetical protein